MGERQPGRRGDGRAIYSRLVTLSCLSPAHSPLQVPHHRQRRVSNEARTPDFRVEQAVTGFLPSPLSGGFMSLRRGTVTPLSPTPMSRAHKVAEQGLK